MPLHFVRTPIAACNQDAAHLVRHNTTAPPLRWHAGRPGSLGPQGDTGQGVRLAADGRSRGLKASWLAARRAPGPVANTRLQAQTGPWGQIIARDGGGGLPPGLVRVDPRRAPPSLPPAPGWNR